MNSYEIVHKDDEKDSDSDAFANHLHFYYLRQEPRFALEKKKGGRGGDYGIFSCLHTSTGNINYNLLQK